jgi:hypothetical protein
VRRRSRPFPEPVEGRSPGALRQAQGTGASERAARVRAAYGRTSSPADEARAAEAARELHDLDLQEAARTAALKRAALDAADARVRRAHRIRSRVVRVSSVLAVLGLAAAGAALWLLPPSPRDDQAVVEPMQLGHREVAPLPTRGPAGAVTTGSAASAERWFDEDQTDADLVPVELPDSIDASTTRVVSTDMPGWTVWIARDTDANFCLIVHESADEDAVAACATPDDFTASGVLVSSVGSTSISAFWDGFDVRTGQNGASLAPN